MICGKGEALVHLDQSKAFDRVDYRYLMSVLVAVGLGPTFLNWIITLYSKIDSIVRMIGFFKIFSVKRSVRQGFSSLSPVCFGS